MKKVLIIIFMVLVIALITITSNKKYVIEDLFTKEQDKVVETLSFNKGKMVILEERDMYKLYYCEEKIMGWKIIREGGITKRLWVKNNIKIDGFKAGEFTTMYMDKHLFVFGNKSDDRIDVIKYKIGNLSITKVIDDEYFYLAINEDLDEYFVYNPINTKNEEDGLYYILKDGTELKYD